MNNCYNKNLSLSIVIPCHNEETSLERVIKKLVNELENEKIDYEIIIVNDNSSDMTALIADKLIKKSDRIKVVHRSSHPGFGRAVKDGIGHVSKEVIIPVMGDSSDDPKDVVRLHREIEKGYDVVYGSRFRNGTVVKDYPIVKLIVNRIANHFIRLFFLIRENDITNSFKAYRKYVIEKIKPIEATEFNITVELPLKALVAGFNKKEISVNWYGRDSGVSKHKLTTLSKKYLNTVLTIWWKHRLERLKICKKNYKEN